MTEERFNQVWDNQDERLTSEEIDQGWHFCGELDAWLCNPDEQYLPFCRCLGREGKAPKPADYDEARSRPIELD